MNHNNDFRYDLEVGIVAERKLRTLLSNSKLEVKRDFIAGRTKNLAIEYECRGFPSGIATTQADWWVFVMSGHCGDDVIVMVEVNRLKELCRNEIRLGNIKKMGDSNLSTAVLLPLEKILTKL